MKNTMTKITVFALCLLLCLPCLFACGNSTDPADTTAAEAGTTAPASTSTGTPDTTAEPLAELEVKKLGGDFKIYWPEVHVDGHFVHNEIDCDEETGDSIDSAVFARNLKVEQEYDVTIVGTLAFCSTIPKNIRKTWSAGDKDFDAFCTNFGFITDLALEGGCADWSQMPYCNTDQQWWQHDLMQEFALGGHKYFGLGDIIFSDNFYPYTIFINMEMYENNNITDDIFDLVKNKQWTVEKMMQMCALVPESSDDVWDYNDTYGILVNPNMAKALYFGAGKQTVTFDSDGKPEWKMDVENTTPVFDIALKLFHDGHMAYDTDDDIGHNMPGLTHAQTAIKMFTNNQGLFYAEELIVAERMTKTESNLNFSLAPVPLVLEDNKDYHCVMNDAVVVCVPANQDLERASLVLSAMGRASVDTLTPAFFGIVLNYRYVPDARSQQMMQIVLDSAKAPDIGVSFKWGSNLMGVYKTLVQNGDNGFANAYNTAKRVITNDIKDYVNKLSK